MNKTREYTITLKPWVEKRMLKGYRPTKQHPTLDSLLSDMIEFFAEGL